VLPFEVASLVLLAALIGAVVISRQDPVPTQDSVSRQDAAAAPPGANAGRGEG